MWKEEFCLAEWILKYWVEILFSAIVGTITLLYKRFLGIHKKEQAEGRRKFKDEIKQEVKESIKAEFQEEFEKNAARDQQIATTLTNIDSSIKVITQGLLSVQRRTFKEDCERLLDPNHIITLDEYQQITNDHDIYNALGGNHNGDQLFALIEEKVKNHLG